MLFHFFPFPLKQHKLPFCKCDMFLKLQNHFRLILVGCLRGNLIRNIIRESNPPCRPCLWSDNLKALSTENFIRRNRIYTGQNSVFFTSVIVTSIRTKKSHLFPLVFLNVYTCEW